VTCLAGLLYFVAPIVPLTAQTVMLAFLALGVAAVFGVGRRLFDAPHGLLGAFFFATAPFVVFSLTNFQLDMPLAGMVALALYALVRAEAVARPGRALSSASSGRRHAHQADVRDVRSARDGPHGSPGAPDRRRRLAWLGAVVAIAASSP
jgi:asparagine N-glycosylation enzyme membrane subunit Stt3